VKFDVVSVGDASLDAILTLNEKEADFHHQQSEGSDEIRRERGQRGCGTDPFGVKDRTLFDSGG